MATPANAGPPYFTDDPEPTDLHHCEIYAFAAGTKTDGSFDGATGLDLNYGPLPDVQLTATLPLDFSRDGSTHIGAGDVEIGVKYRFFQREDAGVSFAVFPRVFVPTAGRRFGSGKAGLLLPLWAQKGSGPWSVFGGGGYTINPGAGNRDFWQGGVAVTRTMTKRLSLGAEIFHQGPDADDARSYTALNFGGIYKLGGPFSILVSAGPGVAHARDGGKYNVYTALALNF
ncbi:MAG: hypothetical protein H0X36_06930 [Sphingomonadaceae bacterium]|nr:hypothetical protein [Sphingomonadaceae bacterium]